MSSDTSCTHPLRRPGSALPRRRARGYTLTEMVAVTTIVGGLGAVAVPRFVSWTTEARVAVIQSMEGAVHTASTLVHMACIVSPRCDEKGAAASLTVAGSDVSLRHGYPEGGSPVGIANALDYKGFDTVQLADATQFRQPGARDPGRCAVTYRSPGPDGRAPSISSDVSGC